MALYADDPLVEVIGVEYGSTLSLVENWLVTYGWTFPVGINNGDNQVYINYGFPPPTGYDTFFVIDAEQKITTIMGRPNTTSDLPRLQEAIDAALLTVPVLPTTWGRLKRLYP